MDGAFLVITPDDTKPCGSHYQAIALQLVVALWMLTWRQSVVAKHINAEVLVIQNRHRSRHGVVRHRELAQRHCHRHGKVGREVD